MFLKNFFIAFVCLYVAVMSMFIMENLFRNNINIIIAGTSIPSFKVKSAVAGVSTAAHLSPCAASPV